MKRTLFILAIMLVTVLCAGAQDRIYFNDSRIVDAIVDEVSDNYVYYRLYGNPEGPVCSTSAYNIHKIVYHNGEEQFFAGRDYYDERFFLDESMRSLLGDQPLKMRYDSGRLYLGTRSRYGAMQADYIAFNLYGDEYYAARNNRKWGSYLIWAGSMIALTGLSVMPMDMETGGAVIAAAGAVCLGIGIPVMVRGNKRLKAIASDYNSRHTAEKSPELTFGSCPNGIGFALNF